MIKRIKTESDIILQIAALERNYFSSSLSADELSEMATNENYEILTLTENGLLKAYLAATVGPYECQIIKIAVAEQRKGHGKLILSEFLKKHSNTKICLEVRVSNEAAQALYHTAGFCIDGIRKGLYTGPNEDGVIMHYEETEHENR